MKPQTNIRYTKELYDEVTKILKSVKNPKSKKEQFIGKVRFNRSIKKHSKIQSHS